MSGRMWSLLLLPLLFGIVCESKYVNMPPRNEEMTHEEMETVDSRKNESTPNPFKTCEYDIFPNGTLLIEYIHPLPNSSSSNVEAVTLCTQKREFFFKPFYLASLAFFFQFQVPVFIYLSRQTTFRQTTLLTAVMCAAVAGAYVTLPVQLTVKYPAFYSLWYCVPSFLNYSAMTCVGWMMILTSDAVLLYLKSSDHISLIGGRIFFKDPRTALTLGALLGSVLAAWTYVATSSSREFANAIALPKEFLSLLNILEFFSPTFIFIFVIKGIIFITEYFIPHASMSDDDWSKYRGSNYCFFLIFLVVVAIWRSGCEIAITERWQLWHLFVLAVVLPPLVFVVMVCEELKVFQTTITETVEIPDAEATLQTITITVDPPEKQLSEENTEPELKPVP